MLLIRGADVYAPEPTGVRDVLCAGGRILAVGDGLSLPAQGREIGLTHVIAGEGDQEWAEIGRDRVAGGDDLRVILRTDHDHEVEA